MLLRTLLMMIRSRRKSRLDFRAVGRVTMRVMPNDLDLLRHVNNGIYLLLPVFNAVYLVAWFAVFLQIFWHMVRYYPRKAANLYAVFFGHNGAAL